MVVVKEVDGTILRNDNIKLLVGAPERARFSDDDLPAKAQAFFGQQCAEILVAPHLLIPVAAVLLLVVVVITSSTKNDRRARRDDDDADRVVGV